MKNKRAEAMIQRRTVMAGAAVALFAGAAAYAAGKPREHVVKMIARKFVFVPDTVKVKQGETVVLHITAPEVPMGFNLPDFNTRADIVPGKVTTVKFVADKVGTFAFVCDVFCGDGHENMQGSLVVGA
jgi:cytochrome c oxidase subunit 2